MRRKLYFHKSYILPLLFTASVGLWAVCELRQEGVNLVAILVLIACGLVSSVAIYFQWRDRYTKAPEATNAWNTPVELQEQSIVFPKRYNFKNSSIYLTKEVPRNIIHEAHLSSFPVSVVINHNEVIFLPKISRKELEQFAQINEIRTSERFDIWEAISEPYLDTAFTAQEEEQTIERLIANGFTQEEIKRIRKKIASTMSSNMFALEWTYLGQFAYLSWALPSKKNYWWAMEIALRNYDQGNRRFIEKNKPN